MRRFACMLGLILAVQMWTSPAYARFQPPTCKDAFSHEQEIEQGKKAAAQVYQQMPVLPDSNPVSQYIEQLGMKLASYAPGYKWPFNFHVADVSDVNAFALPGGTVFVNLGTIQAAETEAQLAGVMAHEISHVVMRHSTCNETKQRSESLWAGLGQLAAGVLLPGAAGAIAQEGIGLGTGLHFLKMSRTDEQQADLLGTDILYDASYDPRGLPQFFEIIEGKYGQGGAQFLSDHPNPGNRIGYVDDEIASLPPKAHYIKTSAQFQHIKSIVAGMHAYTSKEVASGVWKHQSPNQTVESGVQQPSAPVARVDWKPAGTWQQFQGDGYSISYPGNWKLYSDNSGGATIAPAGGIVESGPSGGSDVTYGLLIGQFQPQGGADLTAATQQLLSRLQSGNPQLKPGTPNAVTVNGVKGQSVDCSNGDAAEGGRAEHDWIVTLPQTNGVVRYLVFVAPQADFGNLQPTFESILRTVHLT
jgi:hypothetical protein